MNLQLFLCHCVCPVAGGGFSARSRNDGATTWSRLTTTLSFRALADAQSAERAPRNLLFQWWTTEALAPSIAIFEDSEYFSVTARHAPCCTHFFRHAGASNGSAKYCVSCTTLPSRNSMMLTVNAGRS